MNTQHDIKADSNTKTASALAILVVSFGTSYPDARQKNITPITDLVKEQYPDICVREAWTSRRIIRSLREKQGIKVDTVSEALEHLLRDGYRSVILLPTFIAKGKEYLRMLEDAAPYRDLFSTFACARPLLATQADIEELAGILSGYLSSPANQEALLFMGHGDGSDADLIYHHLDAALREQAGDDALRIACFPMKDYDDLRQKLCKLKSAGIRRIHLTPCMLVAGRHARIDMAGTSETSWEQICRKQEFEVTCHMNGLGEQKKVREMYLKHLADCISEN